MSELIPVETIEQRIFLIRGQKIMIDRDIAELYGVETKHLNRQVKRNIERFPNEFMFQLTEKEKNELVANWHRFNPLKHSTNLPHAFTEHGVAMLASVLNSARAVKMSIHIIKVFIKLKEIISTYKELADKMEKLENKLEGRLNKQDKEIKILFEAIRQLMQPPNQPRNSIGFKIGSGK
ncbi:MAG: ORF6N domain-containing protein [Bacteroidota bacterium]